MSDFVVNMQADCSFFGIRGIACGDDRGQKGVVNLKDCVEDVSVHLASCHLSKSCLSESQLILARSGLFDISLEVIRTVTICSNHRAKGTREPPPSPPHPNPTSTSTSNGNDVYSCRQHLVQ